MKQSELHAKQNEPSVYSLDPGRRRSKTAAEVRVQAPKPDTKKK
jgi:hypothetical protein